MSKNAGAHRSTRKVARFGDFRFRDRLPEAGETKAAGAVRASVPFTGTGAEEPEQAPAVASIYLYDVIDSWGGYWGVSAAEFAAVLAEIPAGTPELHVHLNSPGGEVYEAIAILNLLRAYPGKTVAVVDGIAASAASFIATGLDSTVMGENSELMIHDAWAMAVGNADDFRGFAVELDRISDNIASIYAKKSAGSAEDWRAVMKDEAWYGAQDAVDAKLADAIGTPADLPTGADPDEDDDESTDPDGPIDPDDPFASLARLREASRMLASAAGQPRADLQSVLTQALGYFTSIDSIVDQAQATIAAALGVENPDPPEPGDEPDGDEPAAALASRFSAVDYAARERQVAASRR